MVANKVSRVLLGFGLCVGASAFGQQPPPAAKDPKPTEAAAFLDYTYTLVAAPVPGSVEEAIQKALQHHPDVRLAEAKRAVADAELAQAKLLVTQRVTLAHGKVATAKAQVALRQMEIKRVKQLFERKATSAEEVQKSETGLAAAKADLAAAEAELRAATGEAATANAQAGLGVRWLALNHLRATEDGTRRRPLLSEVEIELHIPKAGSPGEKIRDLIDKPIKMPTLDKARLGTAIDALKTAAGTDLTIRYPMNWTRVHEDTVTLDARELTFLAALELVLDEFNGSMEPRERLAPYVREYGLMLTSPQYAPPGALTLGEYARQVRVEKAAEEARKKQVEGKE